MSTARGLSRPATWACLLLILWGLSGVVTPTHAHTTNPPHDDGPLPVPTGLEVVLDSGNPASPVKTEDAEGPRLHWRVRWTGVRISDPVRAAAHSASYNLYLERVDTGGAGTNRSREKRISVGQAWKDLPVVELDAGGRWGVQEQFVAGSAFRITATSLWPESARSAPIFFGTHPAPEVMAERLTGNNVRVSWTPRARNLVANTGIDPATEIRGGSDVHWVVTAFVEGTNPRVEVDSVRVADTGPSESNPGQITLALDSRHEEWTVQVRADNAAGEGLTGETTVHFERGYGYIELSLDTPQVLAGDTVPTLTVTATVQLDDPTGNLGNTAATLSIDIPPGAEGGTAGPADYSVPADQLPVTMTIPANATHGQAFTATINSITTVANAPVSLSPPKTIIFTGTLTGAGRDISVANDQSAISIYSRVRPPVNLTGRAISDTEWEMSWEDLATGYTLAALGTVRYELTMARVDGGLATDTERTIETTSPSARFPVIDRRSDNAWNGREFIREQGFRFTVRALHDPIHAELIGVTGLDPSSSGLATAHFGTLPAPTLTVTPMPDANIRVAWQVNGNPAQRGSSNITWYVTAFVDGVPNPPPPVEHRRIQSGGETSYEKTLILDPTFPVWTVTVQPGNRAGRGGIARDTVTVGSDSIHLSISPAAVAENEHPLPAITVTATVLAANGTAIGNFQELTLTVDVDPSSTATAADYTIPTNSRSITFTIPANARHNVQFSNPLTGLTIVDDAIDEADETIVFSGTIAGSSSIPIDSATLTIGQPIPALADVEVVRSGPGLTLDPEHWRIQWDNTHATGTFNSFDVFVVRYVNGATDHSASANTTEAFIDVPVSDPDSGHRWVVNQLHFMRGEGYRIEVQGLSRTSDGREVRSARSTPIFFGSHPAPTVAVAPVPNSMDIRVSWTPSAIVSRGGSPVTWEVVASAPGETAVRTEVSDIGPNESNPGQARLTVNQAVDDWTVTVRARNGAGWGGIARDTVTVGSDSIHLSISPAAVAENEQPLPAITVTATVLAANGTAIGNSQELTLTVDVDPSSTATAADYTIPADSLPITFTIPATASHNHRATATLTGLTIVDDTIDDADETIVFSGTIAGSSSIPINRATLTIIRRPVPAGGTTITNPITIIQPLPTVDIAVADAEVAEGESATFTATFSTTIVAPVTISWSDDPDLVGTSVSIPAGTITETNLAPTFQVPIADDAVAEGEETVRVRFAVDGLGAVTGAVQDIVIAASDSIIVAVTGPATQQEGETADYTATLGGGKRTRGVILFIAVGAGGSGQAADVGLPSPAITTVAASESVAVFSVAMIDDWYDPAEETETVVLTVTGVDAGGATVTPGSTPPVTITQRLPTVAIATTDAEVAEGDSAVFTATFSAAVAPAATINWGTDDDLDGTSITIPSRTITPTNLAPTFHVPIVDDDLAEGEETVSITFVVPDLGTISGAEQEITIVESDDIIVALMGPTTLPEGETANYVATLGGGTRTQGVTLTIAVGVGGTGQVADVLLPSPASATVELGEKTTTFPVTMVDDGYDPTEIAETVVLTVTGVDVGGAMVLPSTTPLITISQPLPEVSITGEETDVAEDVGTAGFTVVLSRTVVEAVTVTWSVRHAASNGTNDNDFGGTVPTGIVTFPANSATDQTITVPIMDDNLAEPDESFSVVLETASTALFSGVTVRLDPAVASATIDASDPIQLELDEIATPREGYDAVYEVHIVNDAIPTADITVAISYANAPGSEIVLADDLGTLPTSVTIVAGRRFVTFRVPVVNDDVNDADETYTVTISSATGGGHANNPAFASAHAVTSTIRELPAVSVTTPTPASVHEGAGVVVFPVTLDESVDEDITLDWALAHRATEAVDFRGAIGGTVTFQANVDTEQMIAVIIVDDQFAEVDEDFAIEIAFSPASAALDGNKVVIGQARATSTINSSDDPARPRVPEDLSATASHNQVVVNWRPPSNVSPLELEITGYRLQASTTMGGGGDWQDLLRPDAGPSTDLTHHSLPVNQEVHYRIAAYNTMGYSDFSATVSTRTLDYTLDTDGNRQVTSEDALALVYSLHVLPATQAVSMTAEAVGVRSTFLGSLNGPHDGDDDQEFREQLELGLDMAQHGGDSTLDVNNDETLSAADALAIYYAVTFPELVGDGTPAKGFERFRKVLLHSLHTAGAPTDAQLMELVRQVNLLLED